VNVHHLELFYYVAKFGGITAASRNMPYGIQQPSLSAQITRLEKDLEMTLFIRRPFKLTAEGEILYGRIHPFFSGLPELASEVRQDGGLFLKVAACSSVMRHHIPRLIQAMKTTRPGLKVTLEEVHWDDIANQLAKQIIDVSVGAVDGPFPATVRVEELIEIQMALLVPEDFPCNTWQEVLTRHQRPDGSMDLPLISPPARGVIAKRLQEGFSTAGMVWSTEVEVGNFDVIPEYVNHGFGVGVSLLIPGVTPPDGLRQIALREFAPLKILVLYREDPKPATAWFVEELKRLVRQFATAPASRKSAAAPVLS